MSSLSAFLTACYRGFFFFKFYLFNLWACGKLHLGPLRRECKDFLGWCQGIQMKLLMVGEGVFLVLQFLTQPCLRGGPSRNNNPIRMTEGTRSAKVSLVFKYLDKLQLLWERIEFVSGRREIRTQCHPTGLPLPWGTRVHLR